MARGISPEHCHAFHLVAHGPIHPEVVKPEGYVHADSDARAALMEKHLPIRNLVGAMEKRLAAELAAAGYEVLNRVKWQHSVGDEDWLSIRDAFAEDFPWLDNPA